ncbi:VOC family protein [Granulicella arctica]|uniref:VOC family protein n=1 Tax=Granulicella arctica TaxID=940613 RepID=UPI0021E0E941|nr:VOC family protein [Granulicella arctica]
MSNTTAAPRTAIHWFEIQCADLDRATTFYETLLGTKLKRETFGDPMAIFPYDSGGTGGTLVKRSMQRPGPMGTMIYLNCNGQLDEAIARVPAAGGLILQPKTEIVGGFGYFACMRDSEGNHVGLHSL